MKKAIRLIISGNVQGVFFRQFVKDEADKLGLHGFVKNLENGDVEVVAEGEEDKIKELEKNCKKGPKFSEVKKVEFEKKAYSGKFKEFRIIRFI